MTPRQYIIPLLLLGALTLLPTCQAPAPPKDDVARIIGQTNPADLPPDDAAAVCLATAKRLEDSGYESEAIAEYRAARAYNPELSEATRRLAVLLDRQGDDAAAIREYQDAIRQHPNDVELLNDLGVYHMRRNALPEAIRCFQRAIAIRPAYQRSWINLGMVYADQRRYEESLNAFSHVLTPAQAASNLGVVLAQQGDLPGAAQALRQALSLEADLPQARAALAWVQARQSAHVPPPVPPVPPEIRAANLAPTH